LLNSIPLTNLSFRDASAQDVSLALFVKRIDSNALEFDWSTVSEFENFNLVTVESLINLYSLEQSQIFRLLDVIAPEVGLKNIDAKCKLLTKTYTFIKRQLKVQIHPP
jgi:hypothetical protein